MAECSTPQPGPNGPPVETPVPSASDDASTGSPGFGSILLAYFSRPRENYYYGGRTTLDVGNTQVLATMISDLVPATSTAGRPHLERAHPHAHVHLHRDLRLHRLTRSPLRHLRRQRPRHHHPLLHPVLPRGTDRRRPRHPRRRGPTTPGRRPRLATPCRPHPMSDHRGEGAHQRSACRTHLRAVGLASSRSAPTGWEQTSQTP
jgi:hypothetical protein